MDAKAGGRLAQPLLPGDSPPTSGPSSASGDVYVPLPGAADDLTSDAAAARDAALDELSERDRFDVATYWFKDAVHFRPSYGRLGWSLDARRAHRELHRKLYRQLRKAILFAHLLMAFVECPTSVPGVPPLVLPFFELLVCCGMYVVELRAHYRVMGGVAFWRDRWLLTKVGLLPLTVVDTFIGLASYSACHNVVHFRPLRALRVFYVIENSRQLRSTFLYFVRMAPRILSMFSLVLILIGTYSALGFLLFVAVPEQSRTYFPNYHSTYWSLYVTLTTTNFPDVMLPAYHQSQFSALFFITFILIGVYFLMHVVFAVVLVTYRAHLKADYLVRRDQQHRSLTGVFRLLATRPPPTTITGQGAGTGKADVAGPMYVTVQSLRRLLHKLYPNLKAPQLDVLMDELGLSAGASKPHLAHAHANAWTSVNSKPSPADAFFMSEREPDADDVAAAASGGATARGVVDDHGGVRIESVDDFAELCVLARAKVQFVPYYSIVDKDDWELSKPRGALTQSAFAPDIDADDDDTRSLHGVSVHDDARVSAWHLRRVWLRRVGASTPFVWLFNVAILAQLVVLLVEIGGLNDRTAETDAVHEARHWFWIDVSCWAVFGFELLVQVVAWGPRRYVREGWAQFNVFLFVCSLVYEAAGRRGIVVYRIFSVFRVGQYIPYIKSTLMVLFRMLQPFGVNFASLFLVSYVFAMVGISCFADVLVRDDPRLQGTLYDTYGYWDVNFNTFSRAMVVMFCLTVGNNWYVLAGAYTAVTSDWARLYFMCFFFTTVVVVVNVVIAFFIDIFSAQLATTSTARDARDAQQQRRDTGTTNSGGGAANGRDERMAACELAAADAWFATPATARDTNAPASPTLTPSSSSSSAPANGHGGPSSGAGPGAHHPSLGPASQVAVPGSLVEWKILNRVAARSALRPALRDRLQATRHAPAPGSGSARDVLKAAGQLRFAADASSDAPAAGASATAPMWPHDGAASGSAAVNSTAPTTAQLPSHALTSHSQPLMSIAPLFQSRPPAIGVDGAAVAASAVAGPAVAAAAADGSGGAPAPLSAFASPPATASSLLLSSSSGLAGSPPVDDPTALPLFALTDAGAAAASAATAASAFAAPTSASAAASDVGAATEAIAGATTSDFVTGASDVNASATDLPPRSTPDELH